VTDALRGRSLEAALTVADVERSVEWYTAALGFATERRHERDRRLIAVTLCAGDVRILVVQDDGAKGAERQKGAGFSLQITTTQDIDALAARARAHGVTLDTEPMTAPHGPRIFRLRDPDGFRFTISSPRP
jgi:uncharacterized glyoxalase superfamily protein PhnB